MCTLHYGRWKKTGSTDDLYRHCPKNHLLSPGNVVTDEKGKRSCLACRELRAAQPVPACSIEGCASPVVGRGWCRTHYLRWYRLGSTSTPPRFTVKFCSVEDCGAQAVKWGLCSKHHARMKKRGTTDDPPPKPATCAVEDCERPPTSRGWCKPHHKALTGQGSASEMKRYAQKRGSEVEPVSYERIIEIYGMVCHICNAVIESHRDLNMDHVVPLARGGAHTYANILPAHGLCNRRKSARLLSEFLVSG